MDYYFKDRVITGGNDGQAILWKLSDESQLLYQSKQPTVDCVYSINEKFFASSGDNSTIELWAIGKRAPLFSLPNTHEGYWICSLVSKRI